MNKKFLAFVLSVFSFAFISFVSRPAYADSVAVLKEVKGEVFVQPAGSVPDKWNPISQETAVNNGDSVKTGNGSCVLSYGEQGDFHLASNTSLTVQQKTDTQDIQLKLGSLKAKINKEKVAKPFQVVTPTAVGAVRGTDVDFDFNDQGQLTVDLHDGGPVQVYNDEAGMQLELKGKNKISVKYDKDKGQLVITNSCDSASKISFSILGKEYSADQCQSQTVSVGQTAAGGQNPPDPKDPGKEGPPNENTPPNNPPPPSSPTTPDQNQNNND